MNIVRRHSGKVRCAFVIPVLFMASVLQANASGRSSNATIILFKQGARTSRWGPVALAQKRLGLTPDGIYGEKTRKALREFQTRHKLPANGDLDVETWSLLADKDAPGVADRAIQVTFAMEDTDFDDWEWNYSCDHRDPSGATWGPAGLTIIHNEIQAVFGMINRTDPDLMKKAFGDLYPIAKSLVSMKDATAKKYLKERIYDSATRRRRWLRCISELASHESARKAYLDYYKSHFLPGMKELHAAYPIKTELDYAFYWDLSIHTAGLTETRKAAIDKALKKAGGASLSPSQRRAIIGKVFVDTLGNRSQRKSRTQRNLLFIDGRSTVHGRALRCEWYGLSERKHEFTGGTS